MSALVEDGDRVLAHVHSTHGDETGPGARFVVAEVHNGQITRLSGYAIEEEARAALSRGAT